MATELDDDFENEFGNKFSDDQSDPALAALVNRLEDREPELDLWPGITDRLEVNEPRMLRMHWPVALAASLTLVASTAAITMLLTNNGANPPGIPAVPAVPAAPQPGLEVSALPAGYATASVTLTRAIDRLEQILTESSSHLDATTKARITASIDQLDQAIVAAQQQVDAAPGNFTAARYLTQAMQRKLNVLERVTTLVQQG